MRLKELYCKLPTEKTYQPIIENNDEAEKILQQIRMVLGTKRGEVLGSPYFGIDLNKYLFSLNYSQQEITYMVNVLLSQYVLFDQEKWNVYADISFGHNANDAYEYAVIDIVINEKKCLGILVNQE